MASSLLLFVHGLGGDAKSTFGKFPKLIADDEKLADFDVRFFSYPTSLFRWPWSKKSLKVQFLASALKTQIDTAFPDYKRIILVCHSLGGLIARKYLVEEVKAKRPLRVKDVLLYAVPNNGSGLASIANHISWRHGHLKQLCKDSDLIADLNHDWFVLDVPKQVDVHYVVGGQDAVVSEWSAEGYRGNQNVDRLADRGHIDIVKPEDGTDLVYKILVKVACAGSVAAAAPATDSALSRFATPALEENRGPATAKYRVIGFDADGTLLRGLDFSWSLVWEHLGYSPEIAKKGMRRYVRGETTYKEWCEWACGKYRLKELRRTQFKDIVSKLTVTNQLEETCKLLRSEGFILAIISGGIDVFIEETIPDAPKLFDYICVNKLEFDDLEIISGVKPTPFDFEGKADALRAICDAHGVEMSRSVFVGEGFNDGPAARAAGLSIAYPPKSDEVKSAAQVELDEDDLMKIVPHVL